MREFTRPFLSCRPYWSGLLCGLVLSLAAPCSAADDRSDPPPAEVEDNFDTLIIRGASGATEYAETFDSQVQAWQQLCKRNGRTAQVVGGEPGPTGDDIAAASDRDRLLEALTQWQKEERDSLRWLIFIGHGVSNPSGDYFNLDGPDITAAEVATALPTNGSLVVVCGFSASGGWIETLGNTPGQSRVVMTATQNGSEQNFTRFGKHLAAVVEGDGYDIDHDHQLSWLEAFVAASSLTVGEYEADGRLISEHAALEDGGDGQGVRAEFFEQLRPTSDPPEGRTPDGDLARRMIIRGEADAVELTGEAAARRDELERQLYDLRSRKAEMEVDEYYGRFLKIAQELAKVYQTATAQ